MTMTKDLHSVEPCVYGITIEAMLDRTKGGKVRGQAPQRAGTFYLTGIYIHALPIAKAFQKGMYGWFRIHRNVFTDRLRDHPLERKEDEDLVGITDRDYQQEDRRRAFRSLFPQREGTASGSSGDAPPPPPCILAGPKPPPGPPPARPKEKGTGKRSASSGSPKPKAKVRRVRLPEGNFRPGEGPGRAHD